MSDDGLFPDRNRDSGLVNEGSLLAEILTNDIILFFITELSLDVINDLNILLASSISDYLVTEK